MDLSFGSLKILGCPPLPVTVADEGLVRDPPLGADLMSNDPCGDWHPGQGVVTQLKSQVSIF